MKLSCVQNMILFAFKNTSCYPTKSTYYPVCVLIFIYWSFCCQFQ